MQDGGEGGWFVMCLGVPGKVQTLWQESGTLMGKVDFIGVERKVCFASLPEVEVGEYVLVHVGFALARLDEQNALETIQLMRDLGVFEDELGLGVLDATTGNSLAGG
ncbi:MAG: HypC/HybG/HupF family hydrogenase formation chaperone [Ferrimicrobium sp.]